MLSQPTPFPFYLIPSIPFRRRSSTATTSTIASDTSLDNHTSSSASTGAGSPPTPSYLSGSTSHLRCTRCLTDLCLTSQIISKGFTGRHGRAYLVAPPAGSNAGHAASPGTGEHNLPNTLTHKPVPRQLVTGSHTVSDISCAICGAVLGWKYVHAEEESQKYKIGKFILETKRVCRGVCWENDEVNDAERELGGGTKQPSSQDEEIEFDSQDEDECEDLFAGVWSPALAKKRRKGRAWRENRDMVEEV